MATSVEARYRAGSPSRRSRRSCSRRWVLAARSGNLHHARRVSDTELFVWGSMMKPATVSAPRMADRSASGPAMPSIPAGGVFFAVEWSWNSGIRPIISSELRSPAICPAL